ncbi:hypothetical protein C8Q77DRAFT_1079623 [Trametes polyzona]|nr:hypothetical protein C8Q77DRAFT_1079623 [Trametes polyzona]
MDEFDALPDPFEGVDFDQVPELCGVAENDNQSDYDAFFDDIDPSALDDVPHLGPVPVAAPPLPPRPSTQDRRSPPPPAPRAAAPAPPVAVSASRISQRRSLSLQASRASQAPSSAPSTQYAFDEIDETFLEEVSVAEQEALGRIPRNSLSGNAASVANNHSLALVGRRSSVLSTSSRGTQSGSLKRKRSDVTSAPATPSKRSKYSRTKSREASVDPHASARKVLDNLEEEVTCAICYGLLVAAYSTTCGHSCCGRCLLKWIKTKWQAPQCPVCRTTLDRRQLAFPNVALDNVVRSFVASAAEVGKVDWQPTGERYQDLVKRQEQATRLAEEFTQQRNAPAPPPAPGSFPNSQEGLVLDLMDDFDDDYEASSGFSSDDA